MQYPRSNTGQDAGAPATTSRAGGSTLIDPKTCDPDLAEFLALSMDEQMRLIRAVAQFSNDHALFIVGPDKPSRVVVDGVMPNRDLQPFRVGNSNDPSRVAQAAKWWTWTAQVHLKVHYALWFEDINEAQVVHGLVNIALDGEGWPISSDLHAWHDVPLAKLIEVIERCAKLHDARTRTNEERLNELKAWAVQQYGDMKRAEASEA